jgi:threonine dehydrogenase-like Zn-dependent dehydrogenase
VNTVLKGVKLLNLAPDDTVLVIGQGPIGLMHAALAAAPARACSPPTFSRAPRHCRAVRLTNPIHAGTENVVERVFAETEGRGADAVILAVGGNALIRPHGCGASRRQGDALCPDPARRSHLRPRRGLCGREDPARLILILVPDSGRSHRAWSSTATATDSI